MILGGVGIAVLAGLGCGTSKGTDPSPVENLTGQTLPEVISTVRPGVVRLRVTTCAAKGTGSGFAIAPNLIATADHIVAGASKIEVKSHNGRTYQGVIVGQDSKRDLALVRISDSLDGRYLQFAEPATAPIGTHVIALGFPEDLPFTATQGAVTGVGRNLTIEGTRYVGLLQTDAAVNPGNSGGALINDAGEVIGVVVAGSPSAENIGFGIPGDRAKPVLDAWAEAPEPVALERCDVAVATAGGAVSPGATDCTNASTCPAVTRVTARDAGASIEVTAEYCDRTRGHVNDFNYTFTIIDASGSPVGSTQQSASQTRACNSLRASVPDTFSPGVYQAVVRADNLTNAVSGGATSGHFRIS